jgi:hypothetical protein
MDYSYDLNENGCLIITADSRDIADIQDLKDSDVTFTNSVECEALESLIANSELEWTDSEETGDLTDAPMLCIRDENEEIIQRWAYMDYQVKSFLDDLLETGRAVFVS